MKKDQQLKCAFCKEKVSKYESKYECTKCKEKGTSYLLCEPCRFAEENPHKHKLTKTEGLPIDYPYFSIDSLSSKTKTSQLFLGCYGAAVPNSETIVSNRIKAVLSLLYFDTSTMPKTDSHLVSFRFFFGILSINRSSSFKSNFQKLFFNAEGVYQSLIKHKGVIYYHINLPDIYDPEQLASYGCDDLLQRVCISLCGFYTVY